MQIYHRLSNSRSSTLLPSACMYASQHVCMFVFVLFVCFFFFFFVFVSVFFCFFFVSVFLRLGGLRLVEAGWVEAG